MPEGFDPFAKEPKGTAMPKGFDPFKQGAPAPKSATYASPDGGAAVRNVFPGARITSTHRNNNIGPANDWHHTSNAAVDLEPIPGETFDQFTGKLKAAGYPVIQALDEVKHPSKYATGPHWHVVVGARETQMAPGFDPFKSSGKVTVMPAGFDPFKSPQSASKASRGKDTATAPNRAQRPANRAAGAKDETVLGDIVEGVKNIPSSAWGAAKGVAHMVRHPIDTAGNISEVAAGAVPYVAEKLGAKDSPLNQKHAKAFEKAAGDTWQTIRHPLKSFAKDPVGTAFTFIPAGGAALKGAKLGIRGFDAAKLATMSPEARTALRAQRVEDAATAKRYKDVAHPIMAQHRLDSERAAAELRKHQKTVGNLPVEEQRKLAMAADTGDRTGIAPEHHRALDAIRKVAKDYDKRIHDIYAKGGHAIPEFMDHYYTHLWKESPDVVKGKMGGRQGSSRNLKQRKIPTLADGLRAGLTPKYENMLDTMTHYADTMSKHLVNHDLMNAMSKDQVLGGRWVDKHNIPEGMARVKGIHTEREARPLTKDIDGHNVLTGVRGPQVFAAKSKAAELYNKRIGKSVMDNAVGRAAKRVSGAVVSAKLFSAYHPALIAGKAVASDIGNGLRHLTRFAPVEAVKALAHMPLAPVATALQGAKMGARLLAEDGKGMNEIDHLYVKAGGSTGGGLSPYHSIDRPSMAESALRGTFRSDLKRSFDDAMKGSAARRGIGAVKGMARTTLRALDTVNDLTFRYYVPAIKRGAFERELATSLKAHPEWGDAEKLAEARNVLSSVDGRMGLVTKDNMFWSNTAHDIGRAIFLSPSWQLGNVRILNDAMKGVPKEQLGFFRGKGITNGKAQAAGLLGSYMLGNAVLQYLYTGKRPEDAHDLMAARTGGRNKDGTDERVTPPSVVPELYRWLTEPGQEGLNVINPTVQTGGRLFFNKDYAGHPIYRPDFASPWPHSRPHDIASYAGESVTPIPFSGNDNPNSHVGALARIGGLRPAGKAIADPEGYTSMRRSIADRESRPVVKRERIADAKKRKHK